MLVYPGKLIAVEKFEASNIQICQSCGMGVEHKEEFGTNEDNTYNEKFCIYCFKDGKYTQPNLSIKDMIDKVIEICLQSTLLEEEEAKKFAEDTIPNLERWK